MSGWLVFGGTSASAPIIAGVYALAGNGTAINNASFVYAHKTQPWDVKKGSTGSCGGSYLCTAVGGYDGHRAGHAQGRHGVLNPAIGHRPAA